MSNYVVKRARPRRKARENDAELYRGKLVPSGCGTVYSSPSAALNALRDYLVARETGRKSRSILDTMCDGGTLRIHRI